MTDNTQALASPLGADILTSALVEVMGDADARDAQRLLNALAARGATVASTQPLTEQLAERDAEIARLREALEPFAQAAEHALRQCDGRRTTLAILDRIAAYFISWVSYERARAVLTGEGE